MPKDENEWKEKLTEEQFRILRKAGTEAPFTGKYYNHHEDGTYTCAGCGAVLFHSNNKFESGSGWPSFDQAMDDDSVTLHEDKTMGIPRTEVRCAKCGGHLGHVFPDGPKETTGQRFCINSAALDFEGQDSSEAEEG